MNLYIERLSLQLSGISERQGRALAALIGERLSRARAPEAARDTEAMHIRLSARDGDSVEAIAERIVAEILRNVERVS